MKQLMTAIAGALLLAMTAMTASASTVSGVFAPDPVFSGVLLATGDDVSVPAGTTRTFTTSLFPVAAQFDIDVGLSSSGPFGRAVSSLFFLPGDTGSFTTGIDFANDLLYRVFVRVLASDVAALPIEQQLQFFGTQPPTLFDFTGDTSTGGGSGGDTGTGGGGGTMSPVPLPAAVWLLLAALGGLGLLGRRRQPQAI